MKAWLALEETVFDEQHEAGDARLKEPRLQGSDTSVARSSRLRPSLAWRGCDPDAVPGKAKALLLRYPALLRANDRVTDRLGEVEIVQWESAVARVVFSLFGRAGDVAVNQWSGEVDGEHSDLAPLARRRTVRGGVAILGFVLAVVLVAWYAGRGPYYAATWNAKVLALGLLALPTALAAIVRKLGPPPSRWAARQRRIAGGAVLGLAAVTLGIVVSGRPSEAHAQTMLVSGARDLALAEFRALADGEGPGSEAARTHDAVLVDQARRAAKSRGGWRALRLDQFLTPTALPEIDGIYLASVAEAVREGARQGQADRGLRVIAEIPPRLTRDPRSQDLVREANAQAAAALWPTVVSTTLPLENRAAACEKLRGYAAVAGSFDVMSGATQMRAEAMPVSAASAAVRCNEVLEAQRQRAAREAARRDEQQRRLRLAAERELQSAANRREAAERAWSMASLQCRDGSLSPSCTCGRGSYRGCCSHHGGVSGCSAPYPR